MLIQEAIGLTINFSNACAYIQAHCVHGVKTHIRRSGRDFNGVYGTQLVPEAYNIYAVKSLLLTNNGCGLAQYALH